MLYRSTDRLCRCGAPMKNLAHSASFESLDKDAPSKPETKQLVWLERAVIDRLNFLRGPGESYSDGDGQELARGARPPPTTHLTTRSQAHQVVFFGLKTCCLFAHVVCLPSSLKKIHPPICDLKERCNGHVFLHTLLDGRSPPPIEFQCRPKRSQVHPVAISAHRISWSSGCVGADPIPQTISVIGLIPLGTLLWPLFLSKASRCEKPSSQSAA